jgi:hypothetical protein
MVAIMTLNVGKFHEKINEKIIMKTTNITFLF